LYNYDWTAKHNTSLQPTANASAEFGRYAPGIYVKLIGPVTDFNENEMNKIDLTSCMERLLKWEF
jgi:hypothetical protein